MNFFKDFTDWARENRLSSMRAEQKIRNDLALEKEKNLQAIRRQQANEALQNAITLEKQREAASQPPQIPYRQQTFGLPEELSLYQAYGQAGIDPVKRAEAKTARLKAQAFAEALPSITEPSARVNIGMGKEHKPVSHSGGVFFNQYDPDNPLLDTTNKYKHETALAKNKADEAQTRLDVVTQALNNPELDPLLGVDIANNKTVFGSSKVEIEGKDGKTRQGMARLTPSGNYVADTITDLTTGQPLIIPAESGDSATLQKAKEMVQYGRSPNIKEALTTLTSTLTDTPEKSWAETVTRNTHDRVSGRRLPDNEVASNSIRDWALAHPGEPFPEHIVKGINLMELSDPEKQKILASISRYNDAFKIPETPADLTTDSVAPSLPLTSVAPPVPVTQSELPATPAAMPEQQPLTPVAIQASWTAIQQGKKPEEVQQALTEQGFDISPESVNRMAIDAVNSGVPANVLQQYLSSIGIEWQPG